MHVTALLLAAGSSRRMGHDKLALAYRGETLFRRALAPLVASPLIREVIVVVGPGFAQVVAEPKCRVLVNPDPAEGMASSLRLGVAAAPAESEAWLLAFADMPEVTPALLATLIEAFARSGKRILVPVHAGCNGHPVIFGRACREALLGLRGDVGARDLVRAHPEWVELLPTADGAVVFDVDTPEDLCREKS